MKRLIIISISLMLAGCTSIPLSTMLEFRSFGQEDFIKLDPEHIVAKVELDEPARANIESTNLSVELSSERGVRSYQFPLVLLAEEHIAAESGFFSSTAAKNQYTFQLTDEAIQNFRQVQDEINHNEPLDIHFKIQASLEELEESLDEIRLSLFLKLAPDRDFIPMLRNAKLKIERD